MMAPDLGFRFGSQQTTPSGILSDRRAAVFYPQGYLRPGTTLASAATQAGALWAMLSRDRPLADAAQQLRVVPFWQSPNGAPTVLLPTLIVLTAMGLLVLTIACANIAGLVLVRAVSRRGEIALRLALGATRTRIVRLLIVENLVLAVPGACSASCSRGARSRSLSATPNSSPRPSVSSSMSASTVSSSVLPCWSPAGARWFSDSSRRFKRHGSIWCR